MHFFFLLFLSLFSQANGTTDIVLQRGGVTHLYTPNQQNVFVQQRGVINLTDEVRRLRVVGKKVGTTELIAGSKRYRFMVLAKKDYVTWKLLRKWLKGRRGLDIKIEKQKIILKGEFLTSSDFFELQELGQKVVFENQARFAKGLQQKVSHWILDHLKKFDQQPAHIHFTPHLTLVINKKQKKKDFERLLSCYGTIIQKTERSISLVPVVKIRVLIAQVRRHFFRHWGLEWPGSIQTQVLNSKPTSLSLTAHVLEQRGWGKVLASPTLVAQSNKEARFHSGGEFPIKNSNQFSQQISWKKYGVFLKIKPSVDLNNHLRLEIENQISMPDHSQSVDEVPALLSNSFSSIVNLKHPRPIVLSGLVKKEWSEGRRGLPLLSQIPVFRNLFSDGLESEENTELVFIIDPQIISP